MGTNWNEDVLRPMTANDWANVMKEHFPHAYRALMEGPQEGPRMRTEADQIGELQRTVETLVAELEDRGTQYEYEMSMNTVLKAKLETAVMMLEMFLVGGQPSEILLGRAESFVSPNQGDA